MPALGGGRHLPHGKTCGRALEHAFLCIPELGDGLHEAPDLCDKHEDLGSLAASGPASASQLKCGGA